jgi:predicted outer membrane repeat protein
MKVNPNWRSFVALGLALVLCASQAGQGLANPQAGPLQTAINNAADGATIPLAATTYTESLTINKNLTLKGVSSAYSIIQSPAAGQRVIMLGAGYHLELDNLTVNSGDLGSSSGGGGIYMDTNSTLTMNWSVVSNSKANYGGGIYQAGSGGSVTLNNTYLEDNTAATDGGGLYADGNVTLSSATILGNVANRDGGGIYVRFGNAQLTKGVFSTNYATTGNGGGLNLNNSLTVNGTSFAGNYAGNFGGGLNQWNAGVTVSISGASFSYNSAKYNGGAAYVASYLTLANTYFGVNSVNSGDATNAYGGGLYAGDGINGSGLTFYQDTAACTGCDTSHGGGLFITRQSLGASTLANSTFEKNVAWDGSGISSSSYVQLTVNSSTFRNNGGADGGYGGGIEADWISGDQLVFQGNSVSNGGAGIDANSITLTRSRFIGNTARSDEGGGGVLARFDFTGTNLLFDSNTSTHGYGAALRVVNGPAKLWHVTIAQPAQAAGPAIRVESGATLELKNSILTNYNPGIYLAGTLNEDYNMFYNNFVDISYTAGSTRNSGGHSTGSLDPLFVNLTSGDYHLRSTSYAIGHGANLGVTVDLDGMARVSRWDIGAFQFYWRQFIPLTRK